MCAKQNRENGHLHELDLLYPDGDPRIRQISAIDFTKVEYKQYRDAIRDCLKGHNPNGYKSKDKKGEKEEEWKGEEGTETYDPPAGWARDIHFRLAQKLHLEDWSNVKIFPALGTSADIHHGVDFIVQCTDPVTKKTYTVTVDITLRDVDLKQQKADVMVTRYGAVASDRFPYVEGKEVPEMSHETADEEKANEAKRRQAVADVIVSVLQSKMSAENTRKNDVAKRRPRIFHPSRTQRFTDRGDGPDAGLGPSQEVHARAG